MSKVKAGLKTLKELLFAEPKLMEDAVDPAKRRFLGLPPTDNLLVPVHEDLLRGAQSGNTEALKALTTAAGSGPPANRQELQALVSRFTTPSRRGFLQGAGQGAAHLLMPSPLRLLRETMEQIPLHVELTPSEMMRYSQKYMDRDLPSSVNELFDTGLLDEGESWKVRNLFSDQLSYSPWPTYDQVGLEYPKGMAGFDSKNIFKNDPAYMARAKPLVDKQFGEMLRPLELEPTEQNIKSLEALQTDADFFSPDGIDAAFDDMKHEAQAFASGDYTTVDSYLEQVAKERGQTVEELHDELEQFLEAVHPSEDPQFKGNKIQERYNLDSAVEDAAIDRGYMDRAYQNRLMGVEGTAQQRLLEAMDNPESTPDQIKDLWDHYFGLNDTNNEALEVFEKYLDPQTGKLKPGFDRNKVMNELDENGSLDFIDGDDFEDYDD